VPGFMYGDDRRQDAQRLRHRRRPRQVQAGACKTCQALFKTGTMARSRQP
jgi:hypothetical protein